ncbi:MAG: hypothetical protein IPN88_09005 [Bacteroidetes bacterium]|nr:hypothetical protein [Bacteroidota bacterium]
MSIVAGCKKGDVGPAGPAGTNGTNGTNGIDGNANVIGTNSTIVTTSMWALSSSFYVADITATGITQDIVDRGLVSVFRKYSDGWTPLPDMNINNTTTYNFELGVVHLYNFNINGSAPSNPGNQEFRIVIISSSRMAQFPKVNWNDYEQVKIALGLND